MTILSLAPGCRLLSSSITSRSLGDGVVPGWGPQADVGAAPIPEVGGIICLSYLPWFLLWLVLDSTSAGVSPSARSRSDGYFPGPCCWAASSRRWALRGEHWCTGAALRRKGHGGALAETIGASRFIGTIERVNVQVVLGGVDTNRVFQRGGAPLRPSTKEAHQWQS
jgi:hypothetical protein